MELEGDPDLKVPPKINFEKASVPFSELPKSWKKHPVKCHISYLLLTLGLPLLSYERNEHFPKITCFLTADARQDYKERTFESGDEC